VPALGCERLHVGVGAWNVPVQFRNLDASRLERQSNVRQLSLLQQGSQISATNTPRCSFTEVKTNFNVAHPMCKPGYTNAHPSVQGACFASFEVATAWCNADPECEAVGCSSWMGGKTSGCSPRASKDGAADGPWNGQDSYMCGQAPAFTITDMGCWNDDGARALQGPPQEYGYTPATCAEEAKKRGHILFALQNGNGATGWCVTTTGVDNYQRLGRASNQACTAGGAAWVNHVYQITWASDAARMASVITAPGNSANYQFFFNQRVPATSFRFDFEAKGQNDIHVAFMCQQNQRTETSWEVVLGGWGNGRSVIRKGTQGQELVAVNNSPCDANNFKGYSVVVLNGNMRVFDGTTQVMTANVPALGCERLHVGVGAWNVPVQFRNLDASRLERQSNVRQLSL